MPDGSPRNEPADRRSEWFVPSFGPERFRLAVGLLFLPYTGMVLAYVVTGSMLAATVQWDRVVAIVVIYFLALGIGAHALDAVGSRGARPWGRTFSRAQLWTLAAVSLVAAYALGAWYMVLYVPLLWPIAIAEGFFVLAYNLEWFKGRFHSDFWFALSWGALPVLAGYVMQTNALSAAALLVAAAMALLSLVEIKASRPYKALKRAPAVEADTAQLARLEAILKSLSGGVILLGAGLLAWRLSGG
jgi:voltage-gated potassium channel Kch